MFGGVLTCFSDSLLSIFQVKNLLNILNNYEGTSLFTIQFLLRGLINQPEKHETADGTRQTGMVYYFPQREFNSKCG